MIMSDNTDHVKSGGYCHLITKESRSQKFFLDQGYQIIELDIAFKLGWFKPLRSGPTNKIYGVQYGMPGSERHIRF